MSHLITVTPAQGRWTMQGGGPRPLVFSSGAEAEWCARKLGESLAESGAAADIRILGNDGEIAGRFLFQPPERAALAG